MVPSRSEVWRHAIVGIIIALLLATFHLVAERQFASRWAGVLWWLVLIVAVGIAFAALSWFETYLWKRRLAERINLASIGSIDGQWIDAVLQGTEIIQAGILRIESSQAEGFTVSGHSFRVSERTVLFTEQPGTFKGSRGAMYGETGISYVFKGTARGPAYGAEMPHFGVAIYTFSREDPGDRVTYFEGSFLAREEESIYHIIGRSIPDVLPDSDARSFLEAWLKDRRVTAFVAKRAAMRYKPAA